VGGLADLDVRVATPADAAELLVLQRACWVREGLAAAGRWVVPPLVEELAEVAAGLGEWTTMVARVRTAEGAATGAAGGADGSAADSGAVGAAAGRLVASVRGRVRPADPSVWEVGRLMVAPDLQGRGLGRELLVLAESLAPSAVDDFRLTTGVLEKGNQRFYARSGYRVLPGEPTHPGAVDLAKRRR